MARCSGLGEERRRAPIREGEELVGSLPEGVSRASLVTAAIVDRDFFDRLENFRLGRRNEIRQVSAISGALWQSGEASRMLAGWCAARVRG